MCLVVQSYLTLWDPVGCSPPGSSVHGVSPGKNTGEGHHALLQGIFPTQESNPGLSRCREILYHLSHQGSPRILEWIAYPFSRGSSWPGNQTRVSCIAGGFFINWATREAKGTLDPLKWNSLKKLEWCLANSDELKSENKWCLANSDELKSENIYLSIYLSIYILIFWKLNLNTSHWPLHRTII